MTEKSVDRDPIERLADSFVNRLRAGEYPSISEYRAKYPELANAIPELLPALAELERNASVDSSAHSVVGSQLQLNAPRQLGEYTILQEIGRGGMGVVYEAVQESLGRHVALKVLSTAGLNGTQLDRFRLEACAAARLHHTNIVPVFGVGEDQGLHYYAMQFISGHSLDLVIKEISRLRQNSTASSGPGTGAPQPAEQAEAKAVSTSELISSSEFSTSTVDGEFYRSVGRVGL